MDRWYSVLFFNFYIEMMAALILLCHRLPRRSYFWARAGIGSVAYALLWWLCDWVSSLSSAPFGIEYILLLFAAMELVFFAFDLTLYQAFYCAIISYSTQHCFYRTAAVAVYGASKYIHFPLLALYYTVFLLFFSILWLVLRRYLKTSEIINIKSSQLINLCGVVILSEIVLSQRLTLSFWGMNYDRYAACSVYMALSSALIVALLVGMCARGNLIKELDILGALRHREIKQMELSREYANLINIKAHDLKRRLHRGAESLSQEEREELEELVSSYSMRYHTSNETFNLIMNETVIRCDQAGIDFSCMADVSLLEGMRAGDLYSLLGNALENAIEAVTPLSDKRYIRLRLSNVAELLSLHIENPYKGMLLFSGGVPSTSKPDKNFHGFGLQSIRLVVERYGGTLSLSTDGGVFSLDVLFPTPLFEKGRSSTIS